MKRHNSVRCSRHFQFAKQAGCLLRDVLPAHVCETAAATCRFTVHGPLAKSTNWARGVTTDMQTFGAIPTGVDGAKAHANWVQMTSHGAANRILRCFGLSIADVLATYGQPQVGESYVVDLVEVVERLDPTLLS